MRYSPDIYKHIDAAAEVLRGGGTILYPTDTIWGLGCDACNPKGVKKITALKHRGEHKHYIVLVADLAMLYRYVEYVPDIAEELVQVSDKPLTLIYPKGINLAPGVMAEDGSVAIRIPNYDFCQSLIRRLKRPLLSTSANVSGAAAPALYQDIDKALLQQVDWAAPSFLEAGSTGKPSSIIRVGKHNEVEIIRP
ncbi:MAG: L-threonylcarbamoyladenylate synthase [Bacteroidales bacterium]|jgi:L-threonylcarbamoyladenylate synthase